MKPNVKAEQQARHALPVVVIVLAASALMCALTPFVWTLWRAGVMR